jgi:hypothetical protein
MDSFASIYAANREAQRLFKMMVDDYLASGGNWNPILTDAYLNAEENVRWEVAKARLDDLQAADAVEVGA